MKVTKNQVKKSIQKQIINGQIIFYSYAQKCQATLSILKNQRLLIFNSSSGVLYYVNEPKTLPFMTEIPKPKKQCALIDVSIVRNPTGSNEIVVQFAMKNEKNQSIRMQWNFAFQTRILASEWLKIMREYKAKKISQVINNQNNKQTQQNNQNITTNKAFIHDTLGFSMLKGLKKSIDIHSKQPEVIKNIDSNVKINQPIITNNLIESKYVINSPEKQTIISIIKPKENVRNLTVNQTSNIQHSRLGYEQQKHSLIQSNQHNKNQLSPEIKRSQLSHVNDNDENINKSKITLRDQLESILARSHMRQSKFQAINYNQRSRVSRPDEKSRLKEQSRSKYNPDNDWNLKFLRQQDENVLIDFQIYAEKSFFQILDQDDKSNQSLRCYLNDGIIILVSNARSQQASKLKAEFRNYHFIMQSTKSQFLVGVPLTYLIEFEGLVAIVKSSIPDHAEQIELTQSTMLDLKDLERYTRIKNNILAKATLYDLSEIYDSKGRKLVYIDNLLEYLPVHLDESFRGSALRPEHILDHVNNFMQGGIAQQANRQDMKVLNQTLQQVRKHVKDLAKQLSNQDLLFSNPHELKTLMHQRGINLKYLPLLYNQVSNKNVKKYINTIMVAKVVKDNLLENIAAIRTNPSHPPISQIVQNSFRLLMQGNTNVSSQLWKEISINFRKQFNIPMSNHDILGGFFLNCLMKLVPAKYDLGKLNDKKAFFKEEGIINKGFIVQIIPKTKSFYRYTTELTEKIDFTVKQQKLKENFTAIVDELKLATKPIPRTFYLSKVHEPLKEYLSFFICPNEFGELDYKQLDLYNNVGIQPPTFLSLATTKNYLDWCLDRQKYDRFKQTLEETLLMIDFWFDAQHPYHCEFYETLSNYYEHTDAVDESINFMKQSLAICIRSGGVASKKTGSKYYQLAEKELRAGRKNDSMQNFLKAKSNMQNYNDQSIKYPISLVKLSSLYLNLSDFDKCIIHAKQAVERFEVIETKNKSGAIFKGCYDQYCIKAIEIMTRAFEIENKKNEFYKVAQLSTAKYNKTKNVYVFEQMMKICLTAVIFKHVAEKCKVFEGFVEKLSLGVNNQGETVSRQRGLDELMLMAEQFNVMERFMFRFQSLQRIVADINSRRTLSGDTKEFVSITKNMLGCIGQDYIYGLIHQKQFQ